ncbi:MULTISPECIES: hypothetical protein [unclassified Microbacterium]|uniref:hypothetical protein n=1 Tax=unclassified Microbacterium TaxID=2609290 RepID=UPI000CFCADF1|nr:MULTISPECIES: hypothetical protein [unclassified Microbacterium]PQZ60677.1 hypothetical protein CQ032_04015 [Microbacterium sp. MYb43]PQZ82103.1 hypothetical protein CQ031_01415 [Microbacterium sp. MYb40]PRB22967.1 hypothetical protein CQ037_18190 [Microbacterium sp. MYb50]PRB24197.1 hypothetical protein CQ040_02815 [Microbacterium sp. MYb54]PRB69681.1 hypothetical protein CQ021_02820 [Microbacterium sp. MYb24]
MSATPTLSDLWSEANWLEWRSKIEHLAPIRLDELVTTEQGRGEFIQGAHLLRLGHRQRAGDMGRGPSPMQLMVADLLGAGRFMNVIFEPRRSTKTTAVQAVMLGRCWSREDYTIGWTMFTTGFKAGQRFREDIVKHLDKLWPERTKSPVSIGLSKGGEQLLFRDTGSLLLVGTPNGDMFRSGGFDMAFGDEGGEADIEQGEDVNRAVIPTMDTKPGAQFVIAGTGAKYRTGQLLWESLHDDEAAVLWHGIPETVDRAELVSWEPDMVHPKTGATGGRMREWIEKTHPGLGFTTLTDAPKRSFDKFPLDDFLIEYGGQFGTEGAADVALAPSLIDRALRKLAFPESVPARFSAALKVHHLGTASSLAVAWDYDEPGDLVTEALEIAGEEMPKRKRAVAMWHWQEGHTGAEREVLIRLRRSPTTLWYDAYGYTETVATKLAKTKPRPTMKPTKPADIPRSTAGFIKALDDDDLVIFAHPQLEAALRRAKRQKFGNYGTFRFGPPDADPEFDVSPLEAVALALHFLDEAPTTVKPSSVFDMGEE